MNIRANKNVSVAMSNERPAEYIAFIAIAVVCRSVRKNSNCGDCTRVGSSQKKVLIKLEFSDLVKYL